MGSRGVISFAFLLTLALLSDVAVPSEGAAGEYAKHLDALGKLSVAVAQAMPADQYGFRPHPESMNFGELMAHIASTNYQFWTEGCRSACHALAK
jgi:hypothetical protein